MMHTFCIRFWCGNLQQPKKYYNDSLSFYCDAFLNADFDFGVSAYDVAKYVLPGKVMQGLPCPEVRTFTNGNGRSIMKYKNNY